LHAATVSAGAKRQRFLRFQLDAEAPVREPLVERVVRRDLV
jgi:hypothetical protein